MSNVSVFPHKSEQKYCSLSSWFLSIPRDLENLSHMLTDR